MGAMQSFGQILPSLTGTLGTVQSVIGTVNTIQNLSNSTQSDDTALAQLQERQSLQMQQLAAQNALDKQTIATQAAQSESDRQLALRRAVARQRASFGASGVSSTGGGSSDAVLLGLFEESEDEKNQRETLDALKINALDQDLKQQNSLNLLQATQLAERQSLNDLF